MRAADAGDHVDRLALIFFDEKFSAFGRITSIAVHHQNQIGIDRRQRRRHRARFAASFLGDDRGAGRARRNCSAIFRTIIDDENISFGKGSRILAHNGSHAKFLVQTRNENGEGR